MDKFCGSHCMYNVYSVANLLLNTKRIRGRTGQYCLVRAAAAAADIQITSASNTQCTVQWRPQRLLSQRVFSVSECVV